MLDLHTHVWQHEPGTPTPTFDDLARMCERAEAVGVTQIAVTEHVYRFERVRRDVLPHWQRAPGALSAETDRVLQVEAGGDLDAYVEALVDAQDRGLPLLVGIEVDGLDGAHEAMGEVLDEYPFDVRLGSVHWLGSWLFDAYENPVFGAEWERRDVDGVWLDYVGALEQLAETGMIDVLAHIDVIKVAGYSITDRTDVDRRLCDIARRNDLVVEVSSKGWSKPAGELYPGPPLLDALVAAGVALTTASDAHRAEDVGSDFGRLRAELERRGVEELATFDRRSRQTVRLSTPEGG